MSTYEATSTVRTVRRVNKSIQDLKLILIICLRNGAYIRADGSGSLLFCQRFPQTLSNLSIDTSTIELASSLAQQGVR